MKNLYTISILVAMAIMGSSFETQAQCGSCTPDVASLSPASNYPDGALSPDPAPPITQGSAYSEVITYVMPATYDAGPPVGTVDVTQVIVSDIDGLPPGIAWECNVANCTYFPQNDQYGCITFCGTTFGSPGVYPITVTVIGTALGVSQPTTLTTAVEVVPATGGNTGFTFSPTSGCDSVTASFEALIDGSPNPTTYDWVFANGNQETGNIPADQTFTTTGVNEVTLVTTIWDYVLESVSATAISDQWCGDIEEIADPFTGACTGAPDMVADLTTGAGQNIWSGGEVTNNLTATWSNINLVLDPADGPFGLQFQDVDAVSQWDDLGGPAFNVVDSGTFTSIGTHVNVTYTIGLVAQNTITNIDTVMVNASPADAVVTNNGADAFCEGDSTQLTATAAAGVDYQWFADGVAIAGATNSDLWVSAAGNYSVDIVDPASSCGASSNSYAISVEAYPPIPVITYNAGGGYLEVSGAGGYSIQWFLDGIVLPGETNPTFSGVTVSGPYTVELSSPLGCSNTSFPYSLCIPGNIAPLADDTVCCGETLNLVAEGFALNATSEVIWGITAQADGPITTQAEADAANALNNVFVGTTSTTFDWTRICPTLNDSLEEASYYFTPFAAQQTNVAPFTWDTLQGCSPDGLMCPTLVGVDSTWEIFPMIFTFPDGSQLNVNDELAFGLPLSQPLLDLAGGLPCLNLTDLFAGDPNGVWSLSITNTGPVGIDLGVPDFIVINSADSCNLITQDEVYTIPGLGVTALPGETVQVQFNVPPLPGGFPTVDANCAAFGTPQLLHFTDCYPWLTNTLESLCTSSDNTVTIGVPSGYIDVTASGGTPPYSYVWSDGPTTEDRFNLQPGTYTVTITDANGFVITCEATVGGPWASGVGVEELEAFGFSMDQNIPNPANNTTVIPFASKDAGSYLFSITNVDGRTVASEQVNALSGPNRIEVSTVDLAAGVYYYSLSNGEHAFSKRMMVIK